MSQKKYSSPLAPSERVTAEQVETDRSILAFGRAVERLSRRRFLSGFAGATALAATAGFLDLPRLQAQTSAAPAIPDVLNFALNLEYLEANLYSIVTTGQPVAASLQGSAPGTIANSPGKLNLDAPTMALFQALTSDEVNHINDLRQAITSLGATPISMPSINYGAKGTISTQAQLLATTRQFTALGNSAYAGAAQFLVSNPAVLTVASQILGAEGQHLGSVNYQCIMQGVTASFSTSSMAYLDAYDQPPNPTQYFTVALAGNATGSVAGLAPARTTTQDLAVVYGQTTQATTTPPTPVPGGFFPNGVNGTIQA